MEEKYIFDYDAYSKKTVNEKKCFFSNVYYKWFMTTDSGDDILKLLDGSKGVEDIAKQMSEKYQVPVKTLVEDIQQFCINLEKNGFLGVYQPSYQEGYQHVYLYITNKKKFMSQNVFSGIMEKISSKVIPQNTIVSLRGTGILEHEYLHGFIDRVKELECKVNIWISGIVEDVHMLDLYGNSVNEYIIPINTLKWSDNEQKKSFENGMKLIEYCNEKGYPFSVIFTPSISNMNEGDDFVDFINKYGAKRLYLEYPVCNDEFTMKKYLDLEQRFLKKEMVLRIWQNSRRTTAVVSVVPMRFLCLNVIYKINVKKNCGIGCNEIAYDEDGREYPCHMFMNGDEDLIPQNSNCSSCDYHFLCLGGCKGIAAHNGEKENKELCEYTKRLYEASLFGI